ncbi:SH3 domain-containing protein [Galbibacter sp. BG1]|uniref:SH3 domain-containing protein n=1 Tax=Galbibacter sp. BG1 TaxID=1170699 RepID=UPI0015BD253F|nr:SH3 domain-containing protein [Galbibacter sp. BG1]QLE01311.1 SH3 domain-containing protein [Galbibacter sp. BG1]
MTAAILNLRAGPSVEYIVLEKLEENQELVFLAMIGDWIKVKVKSTKTIGFVHREHVVVVN